MSTSDPIIAAIEAHRQASAAYDQTIQRWAASHETDELAKEENYAAFADLQKACQGLVATEIKTLAGVVALLNYMSPLLQEPGAPAMLLEVGVEDQQWETVFGVFCANLARSLAAIATTETADPPEYVDWVADDIIAATGDLFDDYDVVRQVARAAIASVAKYRVEGRS